MEVMEDEEAYYIRGNKQLWTLYTFKFKKHFLAGHGGDGEKTEEPEFKEKIVILMFL